MTEKRFKLKDYGYDGWAVEDTTGEIFENDYIEDMSDQQVVDKLNELHEENKELKQNKHFFKIVDDYYITYDGDTFNMHKPSDIRSLVYLINRKQGYNELQCEYNNEDIG